MSDKIDTGINRASGLVQPAVITSDDQINNLMDKAGNNGKFQILGCSCLLMATVCQFFITSNLAYLELMPPFSCNYVG